MRFKSLMFFVILLSAALFATACGTSGKAGYLADYSKLREGKRLKKYWSSDSLAGHKYAALYVAPINANRISNKKEVAVQNCVEWLWNGLLKAAAPLENRVVFGKTIETPKNQRNIAVMEIVVTEMGPGSSGPGMLTGEFRAGHAWVRVEGRALDIKTNEELAIFSVSRHSSGTATLDHTSGDAGPALVREILERMAADIIMEVKESFGF